MDNIRQAVERAIAEQAPGLDLRKVSEPSLVTHPSSAALPSRPIRAKYQEAYLDNAHLLSRRIIAQEATNPLSRSFDMLRTQVLQQMDLRKWKIVAVTSPTPGCGKTLVALNLAMSTSRLSDRRVLLVDMDLTKPMIADNLGLEPNAGLNDVLLGQSAVADSIVSARIDALELKVIPCQPNIGSAELIASRNMATFFQELRRDYSSHTIIIDLPPILASDDVITALPNIDCVVLVAAIGMSTPAQIEESKKHLANAEVVRVVLNKVPETSTHFYYSYGGA